MVWLPTYRGRSMILRRVEDCTDSIFDQFLFDMLKAHEGKVWLRMGRM